jgi:hypothetical protein
MSLFTARGDDFLVRILAPLFGHLPARKNDLFEAVTMKAAKALGETR